jgi:uncharacterized protein
MATIDDLKGPAGRLEALIDAPEGTPKAAVVFAHPLTSLGGTMHTKTVYQAAKGLVRAGCVVLRFNFRGAGASEGTFSGGVGEREDLKAALDYMYARYPDFPLWAGGVSFGSWIALESAAVDPRVTVLIGIAVPVAKEGYDFPETRRSTKPKFFIQGERDEVCPLKDMRKFYGEIPEPKELVVIDAADHLFDGKTPEIADAMEDLLKDFNG